MITEERSRLRKFGEYALGGLVVVGVVGGLFTLLVDAASRTNDRIYVDPKSCYADTEQEEERIFRMRGDYCLEYRSGQIPARR
tara:strand:- start:2964 stop:3212 length:249 start_codon:yes stop_codon:yes gene_type:complete